jgi:hypothetical protein
MVTPPPAADFSAAEDDFHAVERPALMFCGCEEIWENKEWKSSAIGNNCPSDSVLCIPETLGAHGRLRHRLENSSTYYVVYKIQHFIAIIKTTIGPNLGTFGIIFKPRPLRNCTQP